MVINDGETNGYTNGYTSLNTVDWNKGEHSGLISIGTHMLSLFVSGPDREEGKPVIVIFPGLMGTVSDWAAFRRMVSPYARVVAYDRSGYGLSDVSPNPPTAANISKELNMLLDAADIKPPYITVGNSWGGGLAMDWMSTRPRDIAGMVFADCAVPHYFTILPMGWKEPDMAAVTESVDYPTVTGLLANAALTPEEMQAMGADKSSDKHGAQVGREAAVFDDSFPLLQKKGLLEKEPPILGNKPICVVKGNIDEDYRKLYEAGVAAGNGTQAQREKFENVLDGFAETDEALQREFFKMSTQGHFIQADKKSGHSVHITGPDYIAEGVKWVLAH